MNGPIMIMAGGTGGHVYPALAVARALQNHDYGIVWLGTRRGLEARVIPQAGIDIEWITVEGLRGNGIGNWLAAPFKLLRALWQSVRVIRKRAPAAVLGMGGFVSGPGGVAAWLCRKPLLIHEQNAVAGLTNRLLARFAGVVMQAFDGVFADIEKVHTVGNPVREDIAAIETPALRFKDRDGDLRLLVLGGSQGAKVLNDVVPRALAILASERSYNVVHQCGEKTQSIAREAYRASAVPADVVPFIEDMAGTYAWADLVVCRGGALTVAEVSASGLPCIFVPYPSAVDDHQSKNVASLVDAGAAILLPQDTLNGQSLADAIARLGVTRAELLDRAERAHRLAVPDSLQRITGFCLRAAGGVE